MTLLAKASSILRSVNPLGSLEAFRTDPLGFLTRGAQRHDGFYSFRLGPFPAYFFGHPEAVKQILVTDHQRFDKQTRGWQVMRRVLGNGLLTSEGDFWRRQRRIAQPAFRRRRIAGLDQSIVAATETMLSRWDDHARLGHLLDMAREMNALTLRIVGQTLLGAQVEEQADTVSHAVNVLNEYVDDAATALLAPPLCVPTRKNRRVVHARASLDRIVGEIIEQRRKSDDTGSDLLGMLMAATDDESGARMSDEQLREEVLTMLLAGHETTATALTWTFLLLAQHPDERRLLQRDLREWSPDRPLQTKDLPSLPRLERVIRESMRLYPPAWMVDRRARDDASIVGHAVPRGALVMVSAFVTHRDPEFWPNPEGFDPDRFLPERSVDRPRLAYFPFGAGPRICIGKEFAMLEAQLILGTVLRRFSPWLAPQQTVRLAPLVTLRPAGGLLMGLRSADA